ncbi:MAG: N-acetyltransferase [Geminicoccaceae bacterium]
MFSIRLEQPADSVAIESLLDLAFGADRRRKTSYRFRDGIAPLTDLCFVAEAEAGRLVGTVRYWPILAGSVPALLLGPLAIEPARQGRGVGRALVFHSLDVAAQAGHGLVFLVGDPAYYERFGFDPVPPGIVMPNESPARLQYRLLDPALALPRKATLRRRPCPAARPPGSVASLAGKAIAGASCIP